MSADEIQRGVEALLREKFADPALALSPLPNRGTSLAFAAVTGDGRRFFVKYPDRSERMFALLESAARTGCRFVAASPFAAPLPFADGFVTCVEWRDLENVPPERWTDAQLESFLAAYREFSAALAGTDDIGAREDDEAFRKIIVDYVAGHPLRRWLLRELLALPPEEYTYAADERFTVTHGDMHSANYGFRGEAFECFLDLDNILEGNAVEDVAYTFLDRAQRKSTGRAAFARLAAMMSRAAAFFGRPAREWRVGVNRKRLRQAASRIKRHPHSIIAALAIRARDLRAVRLLAAAGLSSD